MSAINPDTFSVRWSGEVESRFSETYTFPVTSDDGVRLWVGNQLLIDQWNDHAPRTDVATVVLLAGHRYPIVLEYYENGGGAVAKLGWSSPSTPAGPIPSTQLYPAAAIGTGTGLLANYFDQSNFAGPAFTRIDSVVDFDWAGGSPASAIAADAFSVRWVGEVQALFSETVTFQTVSDDGVRLTVGGQVLIDQWNDHGAATHSDSIALVAGQRYPIVMEFYENGGAAVARLRWTSARLPLQAVPQSQLYPALIPGTGTGLAATYFDSRDFTGPVVQRLDLAINFDWSAGSPAPSIGADTFSALWTGEVQPFVSEAYTFTTISDDGIRVWVGDQLIIDHWSDHAASAHSGTIALVGGQRYPLRVEYYENGGAAVAKLLWASPSTPAGVVPTSQLYPTGIYLLPKVAMSATAAAEGGASGSVLFDIHIPASTDTVIGYVIGGTATAGSDYGTAPSSGTVTIPAASTQAVVTVTAVDDTDVEGTETVTFTMVANPAYVIAMPSTVTVAITDNDQTVPLPVVSIAETDPSAAEAGSDTGRLTVSRVVASSSPLTVRYTVGGTATPNEDYAPLSGSVIIAGGADSAQIDIMPTDDQLVESEETVIVSIDVDAAYVVGSPSSATVTITSEDVPAPTVPQTISRISVSAGVATSSSTNQQFTAAVYDQFEQLISPMPTVTWSTTGGGTITSAGLFQGSAGSGGPYTIKATIGTVIGAASVHKTGTNLIAITGAGFSVNGQPLLETITISGPLGNVTFAISNGALSDGATTFVQASQSTNLYSIIPNAGATSITLAVGGTPVTPPLPTPVVTVGPVVRGDGWPKASVAPGRTALCAVTIAPAFPPGTSMKFMAVTVNGGAASIVGNDRLAGAGGQLTIQGVTQSDPGTFLEIVGLNAAGTSVVASPTFTVCAHIVDGTLESGTPLRGGNPLVPGAFGFMLPETWKSDALPSGDPALLQKCQYLEKVQITLQNHAFKPHGLEVQLIGKYGVRGALNDVATIYPANINYTETGYEIRTQVWTCLCERCNSPSISVVKSGFNHTFYTYPYAGTQRLQTTTICTPATANGFSANAAIGINQNDDAALPPP